MSSNNNDNPSKPFQLDHVDEDYETRMISFELNCNDGKGNPMACHQVGEFYSVVKNDHARAAKVYQRNCDSESSYSASCFNLGRFFLGGRGVEQNDDKAELYFDKACKSGHDYACYNLATLLHLQARDVISSRDPVPPAVMTEALQKQARAMNIYEDACSRGETDSCYFSANILVDRENKDRNPIKARQQFETSCASGHAPSCYNLAVMFKKGDVGVPPDQAKFEEFKAKTQDLMKLVGLQSGRKIG